MEITQIYEFVNNALQESTGQTGVLAEDLTNIVDAGNTVFNASAFDKYVKSLVNHIGKVKFDDKLYTGHYKSVLRDEWEYGSVLEKITADMPDATENESWELEDGTSYDTNIFTAPKNVEAKFFNHMTTFEVPMSITEKQVKQSFSNPAQMNSFLSMLSTKVENKLTLDTENLIARSINRMIADTYNVDTVKDIKLLTMYNTLAGTSLTAVQALHSKEFLRFASSMINKVSNRLTRMSTLYNVGGKNRFTTKDRQHIIIHSDFASNAKFYLESDTFNKDLVTLPKYEETPYWQGTGTDFDFANTSTVKANSKEINYVVGVIFDHDALGMNCYNRRTQSHFVEKAEFTNLWHKLDARCFCDFNENFVLFRLA